MKAWGALVLVALVGCTSSTRAVKQDEPAKAPAAEAPARVAPRSQVSFRAPTVNGGLDPAAVEKNVTARMAALEACHRAALESAPDLAGTMALSLQVNSQGKTVGAQIVDDTMGDVALATCVAGVGQQMGFGAPDDGQPAYVSVPLTFAVK